MSLTLLNTFHTMLAAMNKIDGDEDGARRVNRFSMESPAFARMTGGTDILDSVSKDIREVELLRREHCAPYDPRALTMVQAERYPMTSIVKSFISQHNGMMKAMEREGLPKPIVEKVMKHHIPTFLAKIAAFDAVTENRHSAILTSIVHKIGPHVRPDNKHAFKFESLIRQPDRLLQPGAVFTVTGAGMFNATTHGGRASVDWLSSRNYKACAVMTKSGTLQWRLEPDRSHSMKHMKEVFRDFDRKLKASMNARPTTGPSSVS